MFLVYNSKNKKLGNVAATYLPIDQTCPNSCPLKNNGCYAQLGNTGFQNIRLQKKMNGVSAYDIVRKEAREISAFGQKANGKALRLHVSGDVRTAKSAKLLSIAAEKWDGKVYTYTHAWKTIPRSAWGNISVLASCENITDAKQAMKCGYAPSIIVPNHISDKAYVHDGVKIIPCPQQTRGISCDKCKLCMNDKTLKNQNAAIAFAVHGVRKKIVLNVIK
jgi:hypothetical protein